MCEEVQVTHGLRNEEVVLGADVVRRQIRYQVLNSLAGMSAGGGAVIWVWEEFAPAHHHSVDWASIGYEQRWLRGRRIY